MKVFNPIEREYIAPVDLSVLQNTYNTLEQGHKEAVKATSALKQAIAQYDLNEAEDGWRQSKVNEVQAILQNNTRFGNSAAAVDDLMAASGDILFGPDMMGRLKAQQAWKENQAKIDKMEMPDDYKTVFKDLNKYHYEDKYDENGNIIGGSTWKPQYNPVKSIPLSSLMSTALQWAAKEQGGGSATRWLDANGNVTDDYSKSVTGEYFSTTTNTWNKLSKDKLASALQAVIKSTPGAQESLNQDYFIADYHYQNGEATDILDKSGVKMTPAEYLASKTNPFYEAASFYNQTSNTSYGDAVKAQVALTKANASGYGNGNNSLLNNGDIDPLQGLSNPITIKNKMPIEAQKAINSSKQILTEAMSSLGINTNISDMDSNTIRDNILKLQSPSARLQGLRALSDLEINTQYIESIREKIKNDKDKLAKFDAYVAITSFKTGDSDNPYIKQYNNIVNKTFNGAKSIGQSFADEDTYNQFVINIGGEKAAQDLGIKLTKIDGKRVAILPKSQSQSLHLFTKAANDAYNMTHNLFGKMWNNAKNFMSSNWGDATFKIDDNDNISYNNWFDKEIEEFNSNPLYIVNKFSTPNKIINLGKDIFTGKADTGFIPNYTAEQSYYDINSLVNDLNHSYDNTIEQGGNLDVSNNIIAQPTPNMAELSFIMKSDPTAASKYKTTYDLEEDELFRLINNIDMVQHGGYIIADNNMLVKPTSGQAMELTKLLRNAKTNNISAVGAQDPETGNWGVQITLKDAKEGATTVFIPNIDDETYQRWNNNTSFRAKNDLLTYTAAHRPFNIVDDSFNLPSIVLTPYGENYIVNNDPNQIVKYDSALTYRDLYYQYKDLKDSILAGYQLDPQAVNAQLDSIATKLSLLYNNSALTTDYIKEQIIKL